MCKEMMNIESMETMTCPATSSAQALTSFWENLGLGKWGPCT